MHHRNRRLRRNSGGGPLPITIQHQIADDQHSPFGEIRELDVHRNLVGHPTCQTAYNRFFLGPGTTHNFAAATLSGWRQPAPNLYAPRYWPTWIGMGVLWLVAKMAAYPVALGIGRTWTHRPPTGG